MKRISQITLFSLLLLLGCTRKEYVYFYNNSGANISIVADNTTCSIATDSCQLIPFPGLSLEILVITHNATNRYQFKPVPRDYIDYPYSKAQLDSDMGIYAIKPESQLPVKRPIVQPSGYPIMPCSKSVR